MKMCFGLLVVMFCQDDKPPVVTSDFCEQTRNELRGFKLSQVEAQALSPATVRALSGLRRKYRALCQEPVRK